MTPEIITSIMASIGICVFFVAGYMLGKTDAERKRLWVGLTDEEELKLAQDSTGKSRHWLVAQVEVKLKEKNT